MNLLTIFRIELKKNTQDPYFLDPADSSHFIMDSCCIKC